MWLDIVTSRSRSERAGVEAPAPLSKGVRFRLKRRQIETLRTVVQTVSLAVVIWIGVEFALWIYGLLDGRIVGSRPPGVEGFLPISALISLRDFLITGVPSQVHPAGLVLLVLILGTGLLLKKAFCSWICPVGTISESLAALGSKIFRRKIKLPRALDYPLRSLKYLLLFFFVFAVFVQMTPADIGRFLNSPYNKVADIKMFFFFAQITPFAAKVLLGLIVLSLVIPYFWCRYLCPYGALLGVISLLSPLKITRNLASCNDCGLCDRACPSNLPVSKLKRVRSDECFGCLSCVAACPVNDTLGIATPKPVRRTVRPLVFAALVVALFFGGIGVAKFSGYWQNDISTREYMRRVHEIDSPKYQHAQGQVPDYSPED